MAVTIKVQSEEGTSNEPAKVLVYEDGCLVFEVVAAVVPKQGGDGKWYPCARLTTKKVSS